MTFRFGLTLASVLTAAMVACGPDSGTPDIGEETGEAISDTQTLKEATAAANEIIRNATDCDFVQRSADDVRRTLDDVGSRIQTAAGRQSLDALRRQVERVTDACGA